MPENITYNGNRLDRGSRVTKATGAKGWRLVRTLGEQRYFVAALVSNITVGRGSNAEQILVFRVRKQSDDS